MIAARVRSWRIASPAFATTVPGSVVCAARSPVPGGGRGDRAGVGVADPGRAGGTATGARPGQRCSTALPPALLGVALAGVVAGHAATYLVMTAGSPAELLAASGHGYLDAAGRLSVAAGLFGVLLLCARRLRGDPSIDGLGIVPLALRLAAIQVGVFLVQEVGERWASGAPVAGVLGLLPIGIAFQIAIAALGAVLLRSVLRAVERLSRGLAARRIGRAEDRVPAPALAPEAPRTAAGAFTSWTLRGPPQASGSRVPEP